MSQKLRKLGWSDRSVNQFILAWAPSTIHGYNRMLYRLKDFCGVNDLSFPPSNTCEIANFLCYVADNSNRPESQLKTAKASIGHICDVFDVPNPCHSKLIVNYSQAIVKSQTGRVMKRSTVMPVELFMELFCKWQDNIELSLKLLRLKCKVLLAIIFMCRPSDLAPTSNHLILFQVMLQISCLQ